jgi:hypothetical protein
MRTALIALCLGVSATVSTVAQSVSVSGTLTADNFYSLYYGDASGANLTFVGRNERTAGGSPGTYNWSLPETFSFTMQTGQYLYVVAWDDQSTAAMWTGQFLPSGGAPIYSGGSWDYFLTSQNSPFVTGVEVSSSALSTQISLGNSSGWTPVTQIAAQGSSPWGTIPGLNSQASIIWDEPFSRPSATDDYYRIFRYGPVPEPSTYAAIVGVAGIVGGSWYRARRRKQA